MLGILRFANRSYNPAKQLPHAILKDESHNFRLDTYYIRPEAQILQLNPHFDNVKVYSWRSNVELVMEGDRATNTDMWLYYQCTIQP